MKEVNDLLITCGLPAWIQHDRYSAQGGIPPRKAVPNPILTTPFGEEGSSNRRLSYLFTLFVVSYWICLNLEDEVCRKDILLKQTIAVLSLKIINLFSECLISIAVKYTNWLNLEQELLFDHIDENPPHDLTQVHLTDHLLKGLLCGIVSVLI